MVNFRQNLVFIKKPVNFRFFGYSSESVFKELLCCIQSHFDKKRVPISSISPILIRKKFLKWQDAHPEFPRIVFHGLRHSSATYQLMISGGDIKAVQGTTGHASADMLVNTYAHIQQSSRVELGKKFESSFYAKPDTPSPQAVPTAGEPTISMTALLELLKDADPEMKAKLRLALLT